MKVYLVFLFIFVLCEGQIANLSPAAPQPPLQLHNGLTEKIGNFSIELLYHTSKMQDKKSNLIISPFTVWTVLAVAAEGATGNTLLQINNAIRLKLRTRDDSRTEFTDIAKWLLTKTPSIELAKINAMFVDENQLPQPNFRNTVASYYDTQVVAIDFTKAEEAAAAVNRAISNVTHGKIPKLVDSSSLTQSKLIMTSALYFKGAWTLPFNSSSTMRLPFFSSEGKRVGEVNMMYNRHTYPFANLESLKARVIELSYGTENRLSMLVMLPHPGESLESMFLSFRNITLDTVFEELRISREDYGEDEVDCFLPRFKIESDLDMTPVLKQAFGIVDVFDSAEAKLPKIAYNPLYISKIIHKAQIEVTEQGTTAAGVTAAEFSNRFGVVRFEASRPFAYMIVERVTNSIVFGGIYQEPSLY